MDFVRFAERSAALLNASLPDVDALRAHLADREWLAEQATDRDCMRLRKFQRELRPVFEASEADRTAEVIEGINELMVAHPITPRISDHDPDDLHLHVADKAASVSDLLVGESLLGLANLVCDLGPERLGPVLGVAVHERVRRHLAQRLAPLLLGPVLVARQRGGVPRPAEARARAGLRTA